MNDNSVVAGIRPRRTLRTLKTKSHTKSAVIRAAQCNARVPDSTGACKFRFCISLCCLFHWEPGFHPPLLAFGIVRHVGVAHRRQFTGSVFAGVSMRVRTVGDDFRVLVG